MTGFDVALGWWAVNALASLLSYAPSPGERALAEFQAMLVKLTVPNFEVDEEAIAAVFADVPV